MLAFKLIPSRNWVRFIVAALLLASVFAVAVQPARAQSGCTQTYVVKRGDYLVKIANMFNTDWRYLAQINNLRNPSLIFAGQTLCISSTTIPNTGTPSQPSGIPTISIVSVTAGQSVTIRGNNFPANVDFNVLMGRFNTRGVNGVLAATFNSGNGGTFTATFNIPAAFADNARVAIRLESPSTGFFAFNWFWNRTVTGGSPIPITGQPGRIPTFSIASVVRDDQVTIRTNNFPANVEFNVLMGLMGTRGIGGTQVTTINSGQGGTFTATFDIPANLTGQQRIAIRLESPSTGFFAYNWFWNNTAP